MIILDITTFLGRLHPLIVHLPIGFLLLAVLFDLLSYAPKYRQLQAAISLILLLGFAASVLACVFGWVLSATGEYSRSLLKNHKFSGICVAVLSGILYLASTNRFKSYVSPEIFTGALVILSILLAYSGHQGGTLTHGKEYLSFKTLLHQNRTKPSKLDEAYIFEDLVQAILEQKCVQCHEGAKLKGNLSMASLADLRKGGKHGAAIVPGKLNESELYKRITLNPDNKEYMPADGKTPLTKTETEIIKWWIEKALAVENKKLVELKDTKEIAPQVGSFLGLLSAGSALVNGGLIPKTNPDIPLDADKAQIESLRKKGFAIRVMLQKPMMLDVTLPAHTSAKPADYQPELNILSKNIIWLNVSDNNLTDADLTFLSNLSNLEKLRLEKNPLTDEVCENLINLKHLEAVNLNETQITEAGIKKLSANPAIKRVYRWKTTAKNI